MKNTFCRIAILGGGISGLTTAWFLKQLLGARVQLTIIEKNQRPGGWIHTLQTQGFLFEQGPRSCRTNGTGQETLELIEALGLQTQVITPHRNAKNRYVYNGQTLQPLPKHLWEIPFHSLTRNCLKVFWRDWNMPKRQEEDESIQSFFSRRLGTAWTENLIDPFVSGIYAGDCRRLSLKSCFPLFDQWEQQQGSLLRGACLHRSPVTERSAFVQKMLRFPMFSFQEGMGTLPYALARELKDCLWLDQTVKSLDFDLQSVKITLNHDQCLVVDHVISTLPTPALGSLLPSDSSLAKELKALRYASLTVINIGFHASILPFKGFGYLIPSKWGLPVLGCVWDSSIFPQQNVGNQTRLTLMMGGSCHPEVEHLSENELIEQTLQILRQHLNIRLDPQVIQITKARNAIPQFEVGHSLWKRDIQDKMAASFPRLTLSGSAWTGVSINDCIAQSRCLAQQISRQIVFAYQKEILTCTPRY